MKNTYTLTLAEEELNVILNALQELPAKIANPLANKLITQAREQVDPAKAE
jgi:hypothetical protein